MEISRYKLKPEFADFIETNKTSGIFESGLPDTIVVHYTAGGSASSAINSFRDPDVKASVHVVVDFDGTLTQMIPFNKTAWHAGKSAWLDRTSLNKYSIGIEIVNAGKLEESGNSWHSWFGKTYPAEEVVQAAHRNESAPSSWHRYTEEQITAVFDLCKALIKKHEIRYILGHEEISPGRKIDPGPAFPLDKLRDNLLYNDRMNEEDPGDEDVVKGVVNASSLNIRSGPGANHKTIANPLSRNTEVVILDERNGWYQVESKVNGWVSKKFIKSTWQG